MNNTEHSTHTRATVHRDDRALFLVVADETSLAAVQAELALLPLCARGRVFIEVANAEQIIPLSAPARMTVTWLDRSVRSGRPGTGERCRRGEASGRAVRAWSTEMFCHGPGYARATVLGSWELVTETHDFLVEHVGMAVEAIHSTVTV